MRSGPEMRVAWYFTWAPTSISMRECGSPFHVRILVTSGLEPAVGWFSPDATGLEASEPGDSGAAVTCGLVAKATSYPSIQSPSTHPLDTDIRLPESTGLESA